MCQVKITVYREHVHSQISSIHVFVSKWKAAWMNQGKLSPCLPEFHLLVFSNFSKLNSNLRGKRQVSSEGWTVSHYEGFQKEKREDMLVLQTWPSNTDPGRERSVFQSDHSWIANFLPSSCLHPDTKLDRQPLLGHKGYYLHTHTHTQTHKYITNKSHSWNSPLDSSVPRWLSVFFQAEKHAAALKQQLLSFIFFLSFSC